MSGNRISSGAVILKTGHRVKRQKELGMTQVQVSRLEKKILVVT